MFTLPAFRKVCKFLFKAMLLFIVLSVLWVLCYRYVNPPITNLQLSRESSTGLSMKHHWIHYSAMGDNIKMAVLCGEDQQFKMHNGLISKPSGKHSQEMQRETPFVEQVPFPNKRPKMYFCGKAGHG